MSRTFASLKYFNYRLWFSAALVSNSGTWMQRVAQDWLVLTVLTHNSGVAIGIVTGLQFLPTLILSPYAGVLVDRLNRRRLLMATQGSMGILALALGILVQTGVCRLWEVYVFALLLGCVSAFDAPVRQVIVAELVPDEMLPNAASLNSASFNAARLIGPALSGLLIAALGCGPSFLINGVSFAMTTGALLVMRASDLREVPHAGRQKGQIRQALRYVSGRPDIVVLLVVVGVVSTFTVNYQITLAMMARTVFHKGAGEYGLLNSAIAVGSIVGALVAARRKHPRVQMVITGALALGISSAVMALMPSYATFAVVCLPAGFYTVIMSACANTTLQTSTPAQVRGRVMALYGVVFGGFSPVGAPLAGWIADDWGARASIGVGALVAVVVALWAIVWSRRHEDSRRLVRV